MPEIIDYQVAVRYSLGVIGVQKEINKLVRSEMEHGWQPLGACQIIDDRTKTTFYQTMVKYKQDNKE